MIYKGTTLTDEQSQAATAMITGTSLSLQAPAGSGKTKTLAAGARRIYGQGLNISFNKSVALNAAKTFPSNIKCSTSHSLAFRTTGRHYSKRLTRMTGSSLAKSFDLGIIGPFPSMATKGYQIIETIRKFCYTSDRNITSKHCPALQINLRAEQYQATRTDIAEIASLVWNDMISRDSSLPITHDTYLKIWALSEPTFSADFILFDEAQDANPVIVDVILRQPCQKVFVGDRFQQIYSWRGAVDAMSQLDFEQHNLTKSFRFGSAIATMANQILNSYSAPHTRMPEITGVSGKVSEVHTRYQLSPNCIICRTNFGVIQAVMQYQATGVKCHIMGGAKPVLALLSGIESLKEGKKSFHPDLLLFKTFFDLILYSESPMGGSMKYLFSLIKKYSFKKLYAHLINCVSEPQADIIITTVHKAKGLEWPIVKLSNDFKHCDDETPHITQEETNILYVAATRALSVLDISSCDALSEKNLELAKTNWKE